MIGHPEIPRATPAESPACMFCSTNDHKIPLISLRYQGEEAFVCPRCLPRLVHPERR